MGVWMQGCGIIPCIIIPGTVNLTPSSLPEWRCEAAAAGMAAGIGEVWLQQQVPERFIHSTHLAMIDWVEWLQMLVSPRPDTT